MRGCRACITAWISRSVMSGTDIGTDSNSATVIRSSTRPSLSTTGTCLSVEGQQELADLLVSCAGVAVVGVSFMMVVMGDAISTPFSNGAPHVAVSDGAEEAALWVHDQCYGQA